MPESRANFITQTTATQRVLESVNDMYTNRYSTLASNSGGANSQMNSLQNNVLALKAKLSNLKKVSDTYDREYMDRMTDKPLGGFWRSRGVSTLQDWVLLIFFTLYALICLGLTALAAFNTYNPAVNCLLILLTSFVLGIMIVAVLVRFA
jgi:hypothetical protein